MASKEQVHGKDNARKKTRLSNHSANVNNQHDSRLGPLVQRARLAPHSLSTEDVLQLQRITGNQAVGNLLSAVGSRPNQTGLPDTLKSGVEKLSGLSLDNVKVHYNSSEPAQHNALAFAQGSEIHVASGQEKHLPHEAWHLVQQSHGRVQPTGQLKNGVSVNNDKGLEHEADVMGAKASANIAQAETSYRPLAGKSNLVEHKTNHSPIQRVGEAPYPRDVTILTPYVTLSMRHPDEGKVSEDKVPEYEVTALTTKDKQRPPVWMGGKEADDQGQHKVAWVAISNALHRSTGQKIGEATQTMQDTIARSGLEMPAGNPKIQVTMNRSSPKQADKLITLAHNYLIAKQRDNPSWPASGTPAEKKAQLAGKGERELVKPLAEWQSLSPDEVDGSDVSSFLPQLNKLFDVTGRSGAEVEDVVERAKMELEIHNPPLYIKYSDEIGDWVDGRSKGYGKAPTGKKHMGKKINPMGVNPKKKPKE